LTLEARPSDSSTAKVEEVQQNLPFDEPENKTTDVISTVDKAESANKQPEESTANTAIVENAVDTQAAASQEESTSARKVITESVDAVTEIIVEEPAVKVSKTKMAKTNKPVKQESASKTQKVKLPKKKVKVQSRASSEMAKPETISTVNEIPRDFIDTADRQVVLTSGKMAMVSHVVNRSASGPTKP